MIRFTVLGIAQTAGSKRAFVLKRRDGSFVTRPGSNAPVVNVTDDNAKSKDWRRSVAWAAREALPGGAGLMRGALSVEFTFYRSRPKGHMGTTGLSRSGRESPYPTTRPDVLKLARAAEDALTGVVWADDAQIVREVLRKEWGEPSRLEVEIEELHAPPPVRIPQPGELQLEAVSENPF